MKTTFNIEDIQTVYYDLFSGAGGTSTGVVNARINDRPCSLVAACINHDANATGYTHKDLFELLQVLAVIKGKFILSNYWSQTLRYHIIRQGWNYREIEITIKTSNLGVCDGAKPKKRTEIIVTNFDQPNDLFTQN